MISCRAPLLMRGILIASIEEIIRVVIVQRVEFILGADATVQRLAVAPKLGTLHTSGSVSPQARSTVITSPSSKA